MFNPYTILYHQLPNVLCFNQEIFKGPEPLNNYYLVWLGSCIRRSALFVCPRDAPSLSPLSTQSANGYRPGAGAGELSSLSGALSAGEQSQAQQEIKYTNGVYRGDRTLKL